MLTIVLDCRPTGSYPETGLWSVTEPGPGGCRQLGNWEPGSQLTLNRLSDNVGGVKQFSSTRQHALEEERHFALVEDVPIQPRLARNQYSGLELGPTHASLRSALRS